jgi:hypothetical protein
MEIGFLLGTYKRTYTHSLHIDLYDVRKMDFWYEHIMPHTKLLKRYQLLHQLGLTRSIRL